MGLIIYKKFKKKKDLSNTPILVFDTQILQLHFKS